MVILLRHKAEYQIILNEYIDIRKLQRDLNLRIKYCEYSKTITVCSFYCDDDVLGQLTRTGDNIPFPSKWLSMIDALCDPIYIKNYGNSYKVYSDDFEDFKSYEKEELIEIFNEKLRVYQESVHFSFSRGEKEILDLILSHELVKDNIFFQFWKEGVVMI